MNATKLVAELGFFMKKQDIKNEIWKDIAGYQGFYQISNLGRIKSLARQNGLGTKKKTIIMCIATNIDYFSVALHKNNKPKILKIHRLLAQAFIPNPENKPQVNHKDGNKRNNSIDNLEWVTASENILHAVKNGLAQGEKSAAAKINAVQVKEIRNLYPSMSAVELGKKFNLSKSAIHRIVTYKNWKYV